MTFRVGDRVIAESESTERRPRAGTVREVLREEPPRYRIEWDDGHESICGPGAERLHVLIEHLAHAADLALADAQPEALDELVDAAGGHAAHVCLLHHAQQACTERRRGSRNDGK